MKTIHPLLTVADLESLPDDGKKYELIEGELIVTRAPGVNHQLILANLITSLRSYLLEHPIGIVVPGPGVIFDDFNSVVPDLVYINNERRREIVTGPHITGAPDLAIEIVSPGAANENRDRKIKLQLYSLHQVNEYWVVDPGKQTIEVYCRANNRLELAFTLSCEDQIKSRVLPGLRFGVNEIFRDI